MISSTNSNRRQGNALLIALLLMSVLILITTGLARLVTSETRQIGSMMRNGQAEYLAEGGTELAQFIFYNIEPGYEKDFDAEYSIEFDLEDDNKKINFSLIGTTNHIPVRSSEVFKNAQTQRTREDLELLFQPLLPGQSVEIAVSDDDKDLGFEVEYYIETIDVEGLGEFQQRDLDVLLFRLSGVKDRRNEFEVNFITQYFPAGEPKGATVGKLGDKPTQPASICTRGTGNCFNGGTFFEFSDGKEDEAFDITVPDPSETIQEEADYEPQILDFEIKTSRDPLGERDQSFQDFLSNHNNNIITMTNAINLAQIIRADGTHLINNPNLQEALGAIYFRVCSPYCAAATATNASTSNETRSTALTSPFVAIESVGTYRNTQKILFTELSRPTALSVFDFAIFQVGTGT